MGIVTKKEIEKLPPLLMEEKKLLQELEQAEANRQQIVMPFFERMNIDKNHRTITTILQCIEEDELKVSLEDNLTYLTEIILELKHQEQLNRQLIEHSLQFIQLTLNTINPTHENMNYSNKSDQKVPTNKSIFDSKA